MSGTALGVKHRICTQKSWDNHLATHAVPLVMFFSQNWVGRKRRNGDNNLRSCKADSFQKTFFPSSTKICNNSEKKHHFQIPLDLSPFF